MGIVSERWGCGKGISPARRRGAGGIQGGGRAMVRPEAGHDPQAARTELLP